MTASGEYSEPSQTSKMELFAKIVGGFQPLSIFSRSFILDAWQGSTFVLHKEMTVQA